MRIVDETDDRPLDDIRFPDDGEEPDESRPRFVDSYGLVLVLLVSYAFATAAFGNNSWGRLLVLVLLAATTWMALRASRVTRRAPRLVFALVIILVPISGILFGVAASENLGKIVVVSLNAVLILIAPLAIIRRLVSHHAVNVETFFGAICIYLMIAMLFATMYTLSALLSSDPFFAQNPQVVTSTDYLYFSLTTITTTGYGDLTAAGQVGRLMAMTEAVIGQLYLITVVAAVVENMGHSRKKMLRRRVR